MLFLNCDGDYVRYFLHVAHRNSILSLKYHASYGTHLLDHLAADGACLAGGQVTVVAVGQVDADLGSCLHLELVHSLTSLRDVDLVVILAAHSNSLLLSFSGKA